MNHEEQVIELEKALLAVNKQAAQKIFERTVADADSVHLMDDVLTPVLQRIGTGWEEGKVALSQVYMSGRICEELVNSLLPPDALGAREHPRMAIAVLEDFHMLGKRIVYSVLRSSGFDILDFGRVDVDGLVEKVQEHGVKILLISTLMLPSAYRVKDVRAKLNETKSDVKIIVGGAPFLFDNQLWKEVGADAMGRNAAEGVAVIDRLMGGAV